MDTKKTAHIEKITNPDTWFSEKHGARKDEPGWIRLEQLPWGGSYRPLTLAAVGRGKTGFHVYMRSYETKIRFEGRRRNDPVCQDSCMEFFFAPMGPENPAYFNFEMNPVGVMYIGFSATGTREDSSQAAADKPDSYFTVRAMSLAQAESYNEKNADNSEAFWDIAYTVPFDLIREYMPSFDPDQPGKKISANFYKCGDLTDTEHYVVWNRIETERPDYHQPLFFGLLEL